MKYKAIIGTAIGNGIYLGKPLEENQKTAAGGGWGDLMGFMKQYHIVSPVKAKTLHFWCSLKEYWILLFFFFKGAKNGNVYNRELI